jgi:hypothetical protein
MMRGDLPPSSRVTFLMPLAPAVMILEPVDTLPVKEETVDVNGFKFEKRLLKHFVGCFVKGFS